MMDLTPILFFRPKQASVHLGMTTEGAKTRTISLAAALEPGEDIQTPDKRSLRSVEWIIQILDTEHFNEHATKVGPSASSRTYLSQALTTTPHLNLATHHLRLSHVPSMLCSMFWLPGACLIG